MQELPFEAWGAPIVGGGGDRRLQPAISCGRVRQHMVVILLVFRKRSSGSGAVRIRGLDFCDGTAMGGGGDSACKRLPLPAVSSGYSACIIPIRANISQPAILSALSHIST